MPHTRGRFATAKVTASLAVIMSTLALGCTRQPVSPPAAEPATVSSPAADTAGADKALCTAIAPVMADSDRITNEWEHSGPQGSAARTAALPAFVASTTEWTTKAQAELDLHPDAQPFLRRTLQRYIDDRRQLAYDLRGGGPLQPYDDAGYADSMMAYAGPLAICADLGVKW